MLIIFMIQSIREQLGMESHKLRVCYSLYFQESSVGSQSLVVLMVFSLRPSLTSEALGQPMAMLSGPEAPGGMRRGCQSLCSEGFEDTNRSA